MSSFFTAFFMAFSMFCALPCPCPRWDEGLRGRMLLCLPLVGLVIGALHALAAFLLSLAHCPALLSAAILTVTPFLLTGFLHLDGFLDCADAILSRRDLEERRKILKDSHIGSFAVISLSILLLLTFSLYAEADLHGKYYSLAILPAVTRALAAAAVLRLNPMQTSSYREMTADHSGSLAMMALAAALCGLSVLLCGLPGLSALAALLGTLAALRIGVTQLGGMSGDISGMAITVGEFCGIAALILL